MVRRLVILQGKGIVMKIKESMQVSIPDHVVMLSFNGDAEAEAFIDWLTLAEKEAFIDWSTLDVHQGVLSPQKQFEAWWEENKGGYE